MPLIDPSIIERVLRAADQRTANPLSSPTCPSRLDQDGLFRLYGSAAHQATAQIVKLFQRAVFDRDLALAALVRQ